MSDEAHACELAESLRRVRRPECPHMRSAAANWLYPVEGYCVLSRAPAWLMIPSIEEFRQYCTTVEFHKCPWFAGSRDEPVPALPRIPPPLPLYVWKNPDMPQTRV
jgi:hypothetical protein